MDPDASLSVGFSGLDFKFSTTGSVSKIEILLIYFICSLIYEASVQNYFVRILEKNTLISYAY